MREGMRCTYVGYVATYVSFRDTWRSHLNFPWESYVSPTSRQPSLFSLRLSLPSSSSSPPSFRAPPSFLRDDDLPSPDFLPPFSLERLPKMPTWMSRGKKEGRSWSPSLVHHHVTTVYIKIIVPGMMRILFPISVAGRFSLSLSLSFPSRISISLLLFSHSSRFEFDANCGSLMDVFDSETVSNLRFSSSIQADLWMERLCFVY